MTHDQPFAQPELDRFQRQTGIVVKAVYDTEATKTVGLFHRLLAEAARPICDVFWNNEPARMVQLARRGALATWETTAATSVPAEFQDPGRRWYGFGARVRVLIVNTHRVDAAHEPRSVLDLAHPLWKGRAAIANPLFGSTSTHMAALEAALGEIRLREFLVALRQNDVQVVAGNSAVRDVVADGLADIGLTDTDDALDGMRRGKPVRMIVPDQASGAMGALMLPNTVAVMAGAPHPEEARRLAAFLLSASVETNLAAGDAGQIPLRPGLAMPAWIRPARPPRAMQVDLRRLADHIPSSARLVQQILVR